MGCHEYGRLLTFCTNRHAFASVPVAYGKLPVTNRSVEWTSDLCAVCKSIWRILLSSQLGLSTSLRQPLIGSMYIVCVICFRVNVSMPVVCRPKARGYLNRIHYLISLEVGNNRLRSFVRPTHISLLQIRGLCAFLFVADQWRMAQAQAYKPTSRLRWIPVWFAGKWRVMLPGTASALQAISCASYYRLPSSSSSCSFIKQVRQTAN